MKRQATAARADQVVETPAAEGRWTEILEAAFLVFTEKGYEAATVQDIAARVGLLKGSLYYYIDSKEGLLHALVRRSYDGAVQWLFEDPSVTQGAAVRRMASFVSRFLENLERREAEARLLDREIRHLSPAHAKEIMVLSDRIEALLGEIVDQGVAEGVFPPPVDTGVAVKTILRMLNGITAWYRPDGPVGLSDLIGWYQEFILQGLGHRPRRRPAVGARAGSTRGGLTG